MMLSIGQKLRSAREAKGAGLEDAARLTKIQRKILQAIEEDRVEEVLDEAYAKIFLKKYAAFVGLNGPALVDEYRSLRGSPAQPPVALEPRVSGKETDPSSFRRVLILSAVGLMFLIGISFLGYLALDMYRTLPARRKEPPVLSAAAAERPSPPKVKAIVPRSQPLKLTIRTKADVWMQIKSDGMVIFQNVLAKGAQESWTAREELELWTGNAGALELFLNGHPLGSAGSGVKKGIKVTREGIRG